MALEVIGPGQRTANRKPTVYWRYDAHQEGYVVGIGGPSAIEYWRMVTMGPERLKQEHKYQDEEPLSYNSLFVNKKIGVSVKKGDGTWYTGNLPITSIQRLSPNPKPNIRVTLGAAHNMSPGAMVFVNGAGPYYDGMFVVNQVYNAISFGYNYSYGPNLSGPTTPVTTGSCHIPVTIGVEVYASAEMHIDLIEQKNTFIDIGDNALATYPTGCENDFSKSVLYSQNPHNLKLWDVVQLHTGNSFNMPIGLYRVSRVLNDSSFVIFSHSFKTGTATGGYFLDFGLEDSYYTDKIEDISSNRLKIQSIGSFYPSKGTVVLRRDTLANDSYWGFLSYDAYTPSGTYISVRARTSNSLSELESMGQDTGWSEPLKSGDYIDKTGRYIELEITLGSNDPTKTPILKALHVAYQLKGSQEDLQRTATWDDFSLGSSNINYVSNTAPLFISGKYCGALAVQNTVTQYVDSGEMVIIQDSGGLNNWVNISVNGVVLPSSLGGASKIGVSYRFYNRMSDRNSTSWSDETTFTNQTGDMTVPLNVTGKRYGEFRIRLYTSSYKTETPYISEVKIDWFKVVEGASRYFYTTSMYIPSQLSSIIVAGRDSGAEGTEILYGIYYSTSVGNFENNYKIVSERELQKLDYTDDESDQFVRIGIKLYSASTTGVPELRGFGVQLNPADGSRFLPNLNEI